MSSWCCFLPLFCSSFQVLAFNVFPLLLHCSLLVDKVVLMKLVGDSCKGFWSRMDVKGIQSCTASEYSGGRRMKISSNMVVIEKSSFLNVCSYSAWGSRLFFFCLKIEVIFWSIVPACFSFFIGNIQHVFSYQVDMGVHTLIV